MADQCDSPSDFNEHFCHIKWYWDSDRRHTDSVETNFLQHIKCLEIQLTTQLISWPKCTGVRGNLRNPILSISTEVKKCSMTTCSCKARYSKLNLFVLILEHVHVQLSTAKLVSTSEYCTNIRPRKPSDKGRDGWHLKS